MGHNKDLSAHRVEWLLRFKLPQLDEWVQSSTDNETADHSLGKSSHRDRGDSTDG